MTEGTLIRIMHRDLQRQIQGYLISREKMFSLPRLEEKGGSVCASPLYYIQQ